MRSSFDLREVNSLLLFFVACTYELNRFKNSLHLISTDYLKFQRSIFVCFLFSICQLCELYVQALILGKLWLQHQQDTLLVHLLLLLNRTRYNFSPHLLLDVLFRRLITPNTVCFLTSAQLLILVLIISLSVIVLSYWFRMISITFIICSDSTYKIELLPLYKVSNYCQNSNAINKIKIQTCNQAEFL